MLLNRIFNPRGHLLAVTDVYNGRAVFVARECLQGLLQALAADVRKR